MYGGDEVAAVVLDVGTHTAKGGYAGEDTPKAVFPSSVGVVSGDVKGKEPAGSGDVEMKETVEGAGKGAEAKENRTIYVNQMGYRRSHMEVVSPFNSDGLVEDWDVMDHIWKHAWSGALQVDPSAHPMLLAEPPHVPKSQREKIAEMMFEQHQTPALFLAKQPVLTAFASGKSTALVVDVGGQGTCVTAVHDGYALTKSSIRSPLGGELLTSLMLASLEGQGTAIKPRYSFTRKASGVDTYEVTDLDLPDTTSSYREYCRREIVSDILASVERVSEVWFTERENINIPTVPYELPDGNVLEVGLDRFKMPEVLFQPGLVESFPGREPLKDEEGNTLGGVHQQVLDCIGRCDVDIRKDLYSAVLLTGGASLMPNFRERLERELSEKVSSYTARVKVATPNPLVERKFSVFIGGSILASLGSFQQMWMSRAEYEEHGASLIHRKCP
mmetsp:Transcript_28703/g.39659  ORF Transcript_28703/g.39659 Transcript_28703/m.39659 type:complete len:444 (+) Transcript_28703:220-1551(+)|eukprot:CAMPEP_0196588840 /NCGR_PEP_ID=MMETSP1081-20130531/61880_1 /TAXON_ID=36882 /ORGANISM="Pyramimonas amylifera, Strain CCMP720" /LENGTH=443 /DNA_ID=CAMNT_0041911465 /DNA_START=213 /DNA_END=1544 /DNA_ORIENTATION=+